MTVHPLLILVRPFYWLEAVSSRCYRLPPLGQLPKEGLTRSSPKDTHAGDFPDNARTPARVRDGWVTCGYVALRGAHAPVTWQHTYPGTERHGTLAGVCRSSEQLGFAQHTPHLGVQGHPRYVWLLKDHSLLGFLLSIQYPSAAKYNTFSVRVRTRSETRSHKDQNVFACRVKHV